MKRPPALVMGVPVDDLTLDETLAEIADLVALGRSTGRSHQVATVNVDFLVNALADPDVASILRRADICLPDGQPVVWAARSLGMPVAERVAGADLVPRLVEATVDNGLHVHVFGSAPEVASAAEEILRERHPGADFSIDPGPTIADPTRVDDSVIEAIAATGADVLCVALGNPKQERFIAAHRDRLGIPVAIGVGGSLDLLVGKRRRAPRWMQRAGVEWVARAVQEPRRLGRRYAHDIRVFGPRFAHELRAARRRRGGLGLLLELHDGVVEATLVGSDVADGGAWAAAAANIVAGSPLQIAADGDTPVRDAAAAQLAGLVRLANRHRVVVEWLDPSSAVSAHVVDLGVPGPC